MTTHTHDEGGPGMLEIRELTAYEIAPDGSSIRMNFIDADSTKRSVIVSMDRLQQLALTMPKMMIQAMRAAYGTVAPRLVHKLDMWKVERGDDGVSVILTFRALDQFEVSFAVPEKDLTSMAEAVVEYELEAYPDGLRFH